MNELSFRRCWSTIIVFRSSFVFSMIIIICFFGGSMPLEDFLLCVLIAVICSYIAPLGITMLDHGYDIIHLDANGITVTRFSFSKKKRTQEFLAWENIMKIEIISTGRGGATFFVNKYDKAQITFQFSRKIYAFLKEVYPGEIKYPFPY